MAAALLMSSFLASLRLLLPVHAGRLDLLAAELFERLQTSLATPRFDAAFVGIVEDGWLRYVNAGHNPGFLVVPAGEELGTQQVLAIAADEPFGDDITSLCVRRNTTSGS